MRGMSFDIIHRMASRWHTDDAIQTTLMMGVRAQRGPARAVGEDGGDAVGDGDDGAFREQRPDQVLDHLVRRSRGGPVPGGGLRIRGVH